ncbi:hypothetical protein PR001_g491 [Phytophthora rubi]|uniref:Reverse transcriptase/retrotransposon-derived protein RNase H-like domain-containing protein n=1 Tax=Phytophthora rubi TaxID=129364 RepID=A0A6A3P9Z0_9STRA|nr:hypothetical protein PR001_g491 [Phytophthora rubi]
MPTPPVLILPDLSKTFHVVCDASDFVIGCAFFQFDDEGRERVAFAVYTDHASFRTAIKSPHLSQCTTCWLSLFPEYNFVVHYKLGKTNILTNSLSRRPDYVQSGRHAVDDEDSDECALQR